MRFITRTAKTRSSKRKKAGANDCQDSHKTTKGLLEHLLKALSSQTRRRSNFFIHYLLLGIEHGINEKAPLFPMTPLCFLCRIVTTKLKSGFYCITSHLPHLSFGSLASSQASFGNSVAAFQGGFRKSTFLSQNSQNEITYL